MKPRRLQLDIEVKTCSQCPLCVSHECTTCYHPEVERGLIDDTTMWTAEGEWNKETQSRKGQYFPPFCPLKEK